MVKMLESVLFGSRLGWKAVLFSLTIEKNALFSSIRMWDDKNLLPKRFSEFLTEFNA